MNDVGAATAAIVETQRERLFRWEPPATLVELAQRVPGLELLRSLANGSVGMPPVARCLDFSLDEAETGRVVFGLTPSEFHYNPAGTVHGGVLATLCDSAIGCAVQSTLPAGAGYTTVGLSTSFVRAVTTATGRLRCEGQTVHVGGRLATAVARVTDADERLYAHASGTCMILRPV